MNLHILKKDEEYQELLHWVDAQFDMNVSLDSKAGEDSQVALLLIKQYEDAHFPIPKPDPLLVVKQKMQDEDLKNKDLTEWIGSKSYVSSLLSGKKPLTLKIAKVLHQKLGIPAEVFLA